MGAGRAKWRVMENGVWQRAADRIRESLGQVGYETWIRPLNFIGLKDRAATIEAPNRFFRDWVDDRYLELMQQVLSAEVGDSVEIKLILGKDEVGSKISNGNDARRANGHPSKAVAKIAISALSSESERSAIHPQLNPRFTFAE